MRLMTGMRVPGFHIGFQTKAPFLSDQYGARELRAEWIISLDGKKLRFFLSLGPDNAFAEGRGNYRRGDFSWTGSFSWLLIPGNMRG